VIEVEADLITLAVSILSSFCPTLVTVRFSGVLILIDSMLIDFSPLVYWQVRGEGGVQGLLILSFLGVD
jgi:hypothetical protein